jgi:integrase
MATLKKSTAGIFRVRFRYFGKQFFRSCETTEEKVANQVLTRVEETLSLLKTGRLTLPPDVDGEGVGDFVVSGGKVTGKTIIKETHPLKQVVADYFASTPAGAKSANSVATERTHLDHFIEILTGAIPIDSIGVAELQNYVTKRSKENGIRGRKVQPETLRKELVTFGTMRRWAKARGWCQGEIDRKTIKLPKGTEKAPFRTWAEIETIIKKGGLTDVEQRDLWDCLFLTEKEVGNFLTFVEKNGAAPWLYPALAIAALTGARRSEIMRSEICDFDFTRGIATLREKKRQQSKSMSYRTVEIHPRLATILQAWFANHPGGKYTVCIKPNTPLVPHEALRTFEQTVAGSKWAVLRGWHVLRHSFASICAMKGLRESTINSWMGHETESMKQRYRHLFPDVRKAEMGRAFS